MRRVPLRILDGRWSGGQQPISIGVPLPVGFATPEVHWGISSDGEEPRPVQVKALAHWPDGSVKWLLAIFGVSRPLRGPLRMALQPIDAADHGELRGRTQRAVRVRSEADGVAIETGYGELRIVRDQDRLFCEDPTRNPKWLDPLGCRLLITDSRGRKGTARIETLRVVESGPVRVQVAFGGKLGRSTGLRFSGDISVYAGSNLVRLRTTLENPRRARHSGGYWDLGDPGSIMLQDLSVELGTLAPSGRRIDWLEELTGRPMTTSGDLLEIYQDSSGGDNWQSRNHINRDGRIPVSFRGFRVRTQDGERHGLRASPVVSLSWDQQCVSLALEEFWERFPSAIEVRSKRLTARLLPEQFGDLHEVQAGEHNTRVLWIQLGSGDGEAACERLSWIHDPPIGIPEPEWTAASGVLPFFPSPQANRRRELQSLLGNALDGDKSFFDKRELVDEFGWRHFGDMWADHEGAYSPDPSPVISHYNNQYDLLYGLLVQLLASGHRRWWQLADPLARHLLDVDIYHTNRDKPAYNGGLFWHTAHYLDAGRCTHRTMSTEMIGKRIPVEGGGPANEHNYASGLLLYYYVAGCAEAKNSVGGLADWVIAMDDGKQHVLGVFSDTPTGLASRTTVTNYHGPGRGAGNSINVLLDGWLAFGEDRYLIKLEELIRRTIHPRDDIEARDLLNAELRWSYTVYLQALVRFLELTREASGLDELRSYVREAVLHYVRWIVTHERMYLDEPEKLEYPTETWAAQELRKGTTLLMAARFAAPDERDRFRDRGIGILDRGWASLMSFESRFCTRSLALVLQQGYLEAYLSAELLSTIREYDGGRDDRVQSFEIDEVFVEQRTQVRGFLRSPWKLVGSLPHAIQASRWRNLVSQAWPIERLRQWFEFLP